MTIFLTFLESSFTVLHRRHYLGANSLSSSSEMLPEPWGYAAHFSNPESNWQLHMSAMIYICCKDALMECILMALSTNAFSYPFHVLTEPFPDKSPYNLILICRSQSLSLVACINKGNLISDYTTKESDTLSPVDTKCQFVMDETKAWEATYLLALMPLCPIVQKCFRK